MTLDTNPFLTDVQTLHDTIPFHLIRTEHFEPALRKGMEMHREEIDRIIQNPATPDFANTIVALEKSGALLNRVSTVFGNLLSAETSDEMEAIARREIEISTALIPITTRDTRIGYHSEAHGYKIFPEKLRWRIGEVETVLREEFPAVRERIAKGLPPLAFYRGESIGGQEGVAVKGSSDIALSCRNVIVNVGNTDNTAVGKLCSCVEIFGSS